MEVKDYPLAKRPSIAVCHGQNYSSDTPGERIAELRRLRIRSAIGRLCTSEDHDTGHASIVRYHGPIEGIQTIDHIAQLGSRPDSSATAAFFVMAHREMLWLCDYAKELMEENARLACATARVSD